MDFVGQTPEQTCAPSPPENQLFEGERVSATSRMLETPIVAERLCATRRTKGNEHTTEDPVPIAEGARRQELDEKPPTEL